MQRVVHEVSRKEVRKGVLEREEGVHESESIAKREYRRGSIEGVQDGV